MTYSGQNALLIPSAGSFPVCMVSYNCVYKNEFMHINPLHIGIAAATMNVHQLRHLTFHVRNWGPLWSFSCFAFESLNGELKKYFHGTKNMSEHVSL